LSIDRVGGFVADSSEVHIFNRKHFSRRTRGG
jgi:hypothetical protein